MQDFRQLAVWQKAHRLTLAVYRATRPFPKEELFGITSQLRRAAAAIGANIAEGCGRGSDADFGRFLSIAMGSASEVENHILLARDLELLTTNDYESLAIATAETKKMLSSLILKLRADS
jgi:four helix bundle protein